MANRKKIVSVRLSDDVLEFLDEVAAKAIYRSRSSVINVMLGAAAKSRDGLGFVGECEALLHKGFPSDYQIKIER